VICEQWAVALVPFPFMDMPASKRRPALVISSKAFNDANQHTILAMITTAKGSTWPSDYLLYDPLAAGLMKNCYVRWKTFTLPNSLIVKELGSLAPQDRRQVETAMSGTFGLAHATQL
jgi:mRNA interferase MazF